MTRSRPPARLVAGAALIAGCWPAYWLVRGGLSQELFFPLWLGYILTVDGLVEVRTGSSPLTRDRRAFLTLFLLSAPFWWIYEGINQWVRNWEYVTYGGGERHGPVLWHLVATLSFSTVLPALCVTAELLRSLPALGRPRRGARLPLSAAAPVVLMLVGAASLAALALWPRVTYPLVWPALFLILDSGNRLAGRPSLLSEAHRGRWDTLLVLALTGLGCGLVWELWNARAGTGWVYDVPGLNDAAHLFAMPLPGYLGYVPFAWSAYAYYQAARALLAAAGRLPGRLAGAAREPSAGP
ncbi:hypothetical protein LRS74_09610 [Streptomyces sp. LX-29]|uniref:hypothetical protein n=1 Tax=Streptomyces sp. LX-29 TaxID=2900152 RepID=UPI00240D0E3D|nr:hypothetical protein [Streptomyces sp. LX-29]WFB11977.1 hypothetical protein LRS74_09610 [Streptomyces sp. LX-29]